MSKKTNLAIDNLEREPLKKFVERAYLDYSMYVILDRALPHIGDGLKPVQRRIIYAMSDLGLSATSKHKKSARTIGDVLGKFHPHGEVACYEAMVLMAQPFSLRYPFVDGQGNFGSPDDPKSFAAMRYTEARLSKYAEVLLSELEQGTVEWVPNFDGSLKEPKLLPARLPNILLNGAMGIAVGMATDIPPHNMREVTAACVHLLANPNATIKELCQFVQGPDYPTEAEIITPRDEILKIYQTGNGTVRMRAVYTEEEGEIIITALPHLVSPSKVLEQIAALMQEKKMPLISDLRDESDHENPIRLVITPRSNRVDKEAIMSHLFATTNLENTYRVNLNLIGLDGRPRVKDLKTLLSEWLEYRTLTVKNRLTHRLEQVVSRLHILDGLLIAYLNIDEVIAIIRKEEKPKEKLMKKFKLSEIQADSILELKLKQLAKLEEIRIKGEQEKLSEERDELEKILGSAQRLKTLIKKELEQDANTFGDKRRSPLIEREIARPVVEMEKPPSEAVTVILSSKGWVRQGKGHEIDPKTLSYKTGDEFKMAVLGRSDQPAVFFDSSGRSYSLPAHTLLSARTQGEPLTGKLTPPEGVTFEAVLFGNPEDKYLVVSDAGYGFIVPFSELVVKNRNGKAIMKIKEGFKMLTAIKMDPDKKYIAFVSEKGKLLLITKDAVPEMTKGKGARLIHISKEDKLVAVASFGEKEALKVVAGKKELVIAGADRKTYLKEMSERGEKLPKGFSGTIELRVGA